MSTTNVTSLLELVFIETQTAPHQGAQDPVNMFLCGEGGVSEVLVYSGVLVPVK